MHAIALVLTGLLFSGLSGASPIFAGADCHCSGVSDALDIASGTSQDGDAGGVPDECFDSSITFTV